MSKTYRMCVVLLSVAVVAAFSNSPAAYGQRVKIGGGSNQGGSNQGDKKDKKDKDDDKKDQGNNSNSGNNNNNNGNNSGNNSNKSGDPKKSGSSNVPPALQPFIKGGNNQSDKDRDRNNNQNGKDRDKNNNQGQGGSNRIFPGQNNNPNNIKYQSPSLVIGPNGVVVDSTRKNFGSWKGDRWEGSRKVDNWSRVYGGNKKPFSQQWYQDHPQAWRYNNNKSNVWVVATVPGVYSWLGWGNAPPQYTANYGPNERFDPANYGDWYPLGVFSLQTGGDDMGTRVVQLSVDRHGHVNGNYYDMIADANHGISGDVNRESQRIDFWLNRNESVRFSANVIGLMQPYGALNVRLPGGDQRWQFVRLED